MTNTEKILLEFLRAGITGVTDFDFDADIDFEKVEELAVQQNVLPLVFDGLNLYYQKCGLEAPVDVKLQWYGAAQQAEKHYNEHLKAIKSLCLYLKKYGIDSMILKGYTFSLLYPVPSHRPCGDIDIYQYGKFKEADRLVEQRKIEIDRNHHHHTIFSWEGVTVENHYDFYNVHRNKTNKRLDEELKKIANEDYIKDNNGMVIPSPTLSAIFSLGHVAEHFSSREVKIRHIIDWYLLKKKHQNEINWVKFNQVCSFCGLMRFFQAWDNLSDFLFNQRSETTVLNADSKLILDDIIHPQYEDTDCPKNLISGFIFKIKRWNANLWKLKMIYSKENVIALFVYQMMLYLRIVKPKEC